MLVDKMGYFISLVCMLGYYAIAGVSLREAGIFTAYKNSKKNDCVFIIACTVVSIAFIMSYMSKEQYIYFWDSGSYWHWTLNISNQMNSTSLFDFLGMILKSINSDEYNILACVILAIPLRLFGSSYYAFVILTFLLFYIPACFVIAYTINTIVNRFKLGYTRLIFVYPYVLLFSIMIFPIIDGYVDVIAMLPLSISFLLIVDRDFEKIEIAKDILLGFTILLVLLLRRYYAYAIVGEAFLGLWYWIAYGLKKKQLKKYIKKRLLDTCASICVPTILLLTIFQKFFMKSMFNNYDYAYSAYKSTTTMGEFVLLTRYIGLILIALVIAGVLLNIKTKNRHLVLSILGGGLVTCILFFGVQDMGQHHYYTISIPLCCLSYIGITSILNLTKGKTFLRYAVSAMMVILVAANFSMSFGIGSQYKNILWTQRTAVPKVRNDISTLRQMKNYLEELDINGYAHVYCLASSEILNDDIIRKIDAPDLALSFDLMSVSHVDMRDGFNTDVFDANVIIACDPVQYHLTHGQEVITTMNNLMLNSNEFSDNYVCKKTYTLDDGVVAYIFVKQSSLTEEDIIYVRDLYDKIYPNDTGLFRDRFDKYIETHF